MFMMLYVMGPFCAGTPIMIMLMGATNYNLVEMFLGFLFANVCTIFFCSILHLLTLPFTKYTVFLDDETFTRDGTRVKYHEVTEIVFDSGFVGKGGGNEPCCMDCYAGNKMLVSIEHPSLIMTYLVIRRCKNAKLRYRRTKLVIGTWVFGLLACVALGLYGKYGGQ
jgi:hypothetical protein